MEVQHGETSSCRRIRCGKTTLLTHSRGWSGRNPEPSNSKGRRLYSGSASSQAKLRNEKMGFVFQGYFLLPELTSAGERRRCRE
jgi:putative ABC transport system ATP-binding protein/lipoprotein-releasing system ATP-binding protein